MDFFQKISLRLQHENGMSPAQADALVSNLFQAFCALVYEFGRSLPQAPPPQAPPPQAPPPQAPPPQAPPPQAPPPQAPRAPGYQATAAFWQGAEPRPLRGIGPAHFEAQPPQNVSITQTAPPSSGRVEMLLPNGSPGAASYQTPYQGELQPGQSRVVITNPDGSQITPSKGPGDLLFGQNTPPLAAQHRAAPGIAPAPAASPAVPGMFSGGLAAEIASVRNANALSPAALRALGAVLNGQTPEASELVTLATLGLVTRVESGAIEITQDGREAYYTAQHLPQNQPKPSAPEGALWHGRKIGKLERSSGFVLSRAIPPKPSFWRWGGLKTPARRPSPVSWSIAGKNRR